MRLPPFETFPNLTGEKIILRQIVKTDIENIIEISFYNAKQAINVEQAIAMQEKINDDYLAGNSIHWGIIDNSKTSIVGTCGYYRGFNNKTGELGCVLLEQFRGQGYMTKAMLLAMDFGLHKMGLEIITAITSKENLKARQLIESLGFQKVSHLPEEEIRYSYKPEIRL